MPSPFFVLKLTYGVAVQRFPFDTSRGLPENSSMRVRTSSRNLSVILVLLLAWCVVAVATSQSPVTIFVETRTPRHNVPSDFIGLSFEMEKVLPGKNGEYYFSPSNKPLLAMFNTLGIKNLRVGGNTADRPTVDVPAGADIDTLFAFAQAADVKVIYTLRLRGGDPRRAAETVKYIMDRYPREVDCFAIGNEPNVFAQEYAVYRDEWKRYVEVITSEPYAPGARFCGPSSTPGKAVWSKDFVNDFSSSGFVKFITQHAYPGGSGLRVASPEAGIDSMLSLSWVRSYQEFYRMFAPEVAAAGLTFRIEETNNFFNAGAAGVSNTFASALWGLDYLHWWSAQGAAGVNFHTGDSVAAGERTRECYYAVFIASQTGYDVRPLGYAVKAFELGSNGSVVPVRFAEKSEKPNITAYGVLAIDGSLLVTLINKEHGTESSKTTVSLKPDAAFTTAETIVLTAPDVASTTGVKLGNAEIQSGGLWNGTWMPVTAPPGDGMFTVTLPPASAVVVRLRK